jgi:formiminotetrahydrofolate cyclodeaminase
VSGLESWSLAEWLQGLARRDPTPAGGALALTTLAGAAALAAKVARLGGVTVPGFEAGARYFLRAAERDAELYAGAAGGEPEALRASLQASLDDLGSAAEFLEELSPLFPRLKPGLEADLAAAERLARAAARTLSVNLAVNLSAWSERCGGLEDLAARWRGLRARLESA